jgi:hypothetical protein
MFPNACWVCVHNVAHGHHHDRAQHEIDYFFRATGCAFCYNSTTEGTPVYARGGRSDGFTVRHSQRMPAREAIADG